VKNLFGKMFASAVLAGAETASAAMVVLHTRNQGGSLTAELKAVSMHAHHASEGNVRVIADDGARYADFVRRAIDSGQPIEETFKVAVVDADGEPTHSFELTWEIREK
jgi:hypothetical protein